MNTVSETIPHDDSDGISVFLLDETNIELYLNRPEHEVNFTDVYYNEVG